VFINDPAALLAVLPTEDDAATTWRAKSETQQAAQDRPGAGFFFIRKSSKG
jgi:hypothetical protein